jgi:hypothetical protein
VTWFRVDDGFHDHPKTWDAPDCAISLWTRAGAYSSAKGLGGYVPAGMCARWTEDPERAIAELLRRRLWTRTKGGYQFHDWTDRNPSVEEAQAAAEKMSSGGAIGNHRRWHVGKGKTDPRCRYCQDKPDRDSHRVPDRDSDTAPESALNPPDPARPNKTTRSPYGTPGRNARADEAPPSDAEPSRVETLIAEYRDASPRGLPSRQAEKLAAEIHTLIRDGYTDTEIREGLGQLRIRKLGPSVLPSLVDELANAATTAAPGTNVVPFAGRGQHRPSTTDQRVGQALALADRFRTEEQP